ncbi:hypothetical protein Gotur_004767, partial [Gossypium turneri]
MHQTDRVLRQFGFRQPIPVAPEVLDDEHKIDLRRPDTHWPLFHSEYIEIWENRYDNIPTRESIIVPESACDPDYMPWFRIHGKPYLLSEEERRRQIYAKRERRGPLNPRTRGGEAGLSTAPTQSSAPTEQATMPTPQPLQIMLSAYSNSYMYPFSTPMPSWNVWPGASHFPMTPTQPTIYTPSSQKGLHEAPLGSSTHFQYPAPWVMQ